MGRGIQPIATEEEIIIERDGLRYKWETNAPAAELLPLQKASDSDKNGTIKYNLAAVDPKCGEEYLDHLKHVFYRNAIIADPAPQKGYKSEKLKSQGWVGIYVCR